MNRANTNADGPQPAGFTLMEILIAMLILAIGIMATLSMQFTALGGASEARDNANASEVAKRVLHVMRVEAQGWRAGAASSVTEATFSDGAFAVSPILPATVASWSWTQIFTDPVDTRLSTAGNARYCAYTRGGYLEGDSTTGVAKIQIAVVYPGANETFPGGDCPAANDDLIQTKLDPSLAPEDSLQIDGYRANYFGGVITRRGYLPQL